MQPDINVLVLSAGLSSAFHFIKTIKKKFKNKFFIVAADINEEYMISACKFIDKFYKVPLSVSPDYYNIIIDIIKKEKIDYILPLLDKDRSLFYPQNEDLIKLNVKSLSSSNFEFSKEEINKLLKLNGFKIPKEYKINELCDNEKYFVKPKLGIGSIDAQILSKEQILSKYNNSGYLIQEICKKPEITLECFYHNGRMSTVARERIEAKAGICSKAKVYKDKELENIAKKFIEKFKPNRFFNLQFMKNSKNEFVITDVNYRLAGAMGLSYEAGWDEVSALANIMMDKNDDEIFSSFKLNHSVQYVLRTYNNLVTKSIDTIAFDLDGTILNSFDRHKYVLSIALKKYDVSLNLDDYITSKRMGLNNIKYLIKKGVDRILADNIQTFWIKNIENYEYLKLDFIYPQALKLLNKLKENSNLVLITARNNKQTCKVQINNLKLDSYFSEIYIVDSCKNTPILKSEVLINTLAKEMYGDTETDMLACRIADIKFNPVFYGFRDKNLLNQTPPPGSKNKVLNNILFVKIHNFFHKKEAA